MGYDFHNAPSAADFVMVSEDWTDVLPNSQKLGAFTITFASDVPLYWGDADEAGREWNTVQTQPALIDGLGASNTLIVTTKANMISADDLGLAAQSDPAICITSGTSWGSATDEYILIYHDKTNAHLYTASGDWYINGSIYTTTNIVMGTSDQLIQGDTSNYTQSFDGTDFVIAFAAMANNTIGAGWDLTLPNGGTSTTGNGIFGGAMTVTTGDGSAAFATEGGDGGAGGNIDFVFGAGGAGDGGGSAGATGILNIQGKTRITLGGSLFVTEMSAAAVDVAGDGQFWVKDGTPNTAWFTDDAGTDFALVTPPGGSDTHVQFNNSGAFGGSASFTWDGSQVATIKQTITPTSAVDGMTIIQANVARAMFVNQDGNETGIEIDSEATSLSAIWAHGKYAGFFQQDLPGGRGLIVSRNIAEAGAEPLVTFLNDNASDTAGALLVQQDGAGTAVTVDQNANSTGVRIDSEASTAVALYVTGAKGLAITQDLTSGYGALIQRDLAEAGSSPLLWLINDNASDTQATILMQNDGSGPHITTGATNEHLIISPNGVGRVYMQAVVELATNHAISTPNTDGTTYTFEARDTGVGQVEVGRVQSAADPYFSVGGSQEYKFYNSGVFEIGDTKSISTGSADDDWFSIRAKINGGAMSNIVAVVSAADPYVEFGVGGEYKFYRSGITDFTGNVTMNNAAGPVIIDAAASSTVPTLVPNRAEGDTGIGWASDTLHMVLGGATYGYFSKTKFEIDGTITGAGSTNFGGLHIEQTATMALADSYEGIFISPAVTEHTTGTHPTIAGMYINNFTVTDGGGDEVVTNLAGLYIAGAPVAGTQPTNGPYSIFVDAGACRFDGAVTIGDDGATNVAQFAADGELTLAGTARVMKEIRVSAQALGQGATKPAESIVDNFTIQSYGINDDSVFEFEVPADWSPGTDIIPHLHWACNETYATANGEVQWELVWRAVANGEVYSSGGTTATIDSGDINIPAAARELTENDLGTISGGSLTAGDIIGCTLKRVALDAGVDPTAEPEVIVIDFEYISDRLGEST